MELMAGYTLVYHMWGPPEFILQEHHCIGILFCKGVSSFFVCLIGYRKYNYTANMINSTIHIILIEIKFGRIRLKWANIIILRWHINKVLAAFN